MTTVRRQSRDGSRDHALQLRALARRLADAKELERRALTRELHDRVGPSLTALNLILNKLASELPRNASDRTRQDLRESLQLVEATAESIENVMVDLQPPMLGQGGLLAALRWYTGWFARRAAVTITVYGREPEPRLARDIEVALFRIAQGALTNIARHARARIVRVELRHDPGRVTLAIVDDGAGFDAAATERSPQRWGIAGMRERATAVGGSLRIESTPGAGTRVIVEVEHRA